jgi:diguanylate cyclase (GGDEF)-like protein
MNKAGAVPRPGSKAARWLQRCQWFLLVLYTLVLSLPGIGVTSSAFFVIANLAALAPGVVIAARAVLVRADRVWCWLLVAGIASFCAGNVAYAWVQEQAHPPFPSWADAGYLAIYPFVIAALLVSLRTRLGRLRLSIALDAVVGALAATTVCSWLITPLTRTFDLPTFQLVVSVAYPVGDVLIIAAVVGVLAVTGGRPGGFYPYLFAGLLIFAIADTVYTYRVAYDSYQVGQPIDALWPLGLAIVAHGVWRPRSPRQARPEVGLASLWIVALAASAALVVLTAAPHADAPYAVTLLAAATLLACGGRVAEAFVRVRDLASVRKQALTDDLTQVGNRRLLYQRMEQALHLRTDGRSVALVLLDLDRFKEVNDSLGHHTGDELLQEVGDRLSEEVGAVGPDVLLARLGGDEFAVLIPDVAPQAAIEIAQRLHDCLTGPVQLGNILLHTNASAGLALAPSHADNRSDLLRCADLAMYHAKRAGRGVALYEAGLLTLTSDRLEMAEQLHHAVRDGQLEVHYQPQVDAMGQVPSVEALVRWGHPTLGLVSPEVFLPIAEERRLMPDITRLVLDTALSDCAAWRSIGYPMAVAVNLSAPDLLDIGLPGVVTQMLTTHGLEPDALILEITETTVMTDPVQAQKTLQTLRGLGVELAVDDYGTGHCSLAYLRRLPVQELKLDRSFVEHAHTDAKDAAIVTSTVQLARALGLRMVGEGVESAAVADLLFAAGVDRVQGWHYARAMPVSDLLDWCTNWQQLTPRRTSEPAALPL